MSYEKSSTITKRRSAVLTISPSKLGKGSKAYVSAKIFPKFVAQSVDLFLDTEAKKGRVVIYNGTQGEYKIDNQRRQFWLGADASALITSGAEMIKFKCKHIAEGEFEFSYAGAK